MTGKDSINLGLGNIWRSWLNFRKSKHVTAELDAFQFDLEKIFFELERDLANGNYHHGPYKKFIVCDNKKREISVAGIRDRVVHRLVYDYLVPIFDQTFIYDAWSCRKEKGLFGAIERAQEFLKSYPNAFVWRADIKKFFDSVNQEILMRILFRKVTDPKACQLIHGIIRSFAERERERERVLYRNAHRQSDEPDFRQYLYERI